MLSGKLYFKSHHKIQIDLIEEINGTTSAIGLVKTFKTVGWERSVIEQFIGRLEESLNKQKVFHCKNYLRVEERNNYSVLKVK